MPKQEKEYKKTKEKRNGETVYEISWTVMRPVRIYVTLSELEAKKMLLEKQLKEVEADIAEIKKLK